MSNPLDKFLRNPILQKSINVDRTRLQQAITIDQALPPPVVNLPPALPPPVFPPPALNIGAPPPLTAGATTKPTPYFLPQEIPSASSKHKLCIYNRSK